MTVLLSELPGCEVGDDRVRELLVGAVDMALERAGLPWAEVSLTLVDDAEIARLNGEYRGVHGPTDVLSFPLLEADELAVQAARGASPGAPPLLLGDVVISVERAFRQAEEYGHSAARELAFLAVHGTLHLLGYDHERPEDEARMMGETEAILAALGLTRRQHG